MQNDFHEIASDIQGSRKVELASNICDRDRTHTIQHYADSWLYFLRATRGDYGDPGYLISRDGFHVGLGCRNKTIYLVRPRGKNTFDNILSICNHLDKYFDTKIIIKKVEENLIEVLEGSGKFVSRECFLDRHLLEDEAHPELSVNLDKLFPQAGLLSLQARNLRRKVRKFEENNPSTLSVTDIGNQPYTSDRIVSFLARDQAKARSYSLIIDRVSLTKTQDAYFSSIYSNARNVIEGVYIAERLNADTAGLYCAVSSKSRIGITEWMDVRFFRKLHDKGIKRVLLGGCETDGVAAYCQKLLVEGTSYWMEPFVFMPRNSEARREGVRNADISAAA